ncbi:aminodeoxychorismate/anthranilate synthase component II [Candidatus Micrarchaeota archaeon]|nr:aminodeoxychorismate/anthranilate synthase component II [Candidatus Micrarchaeota archaeon]
MKKVLIIDNFDSFTFNLVEEFDKRDCKTLVYRNDISIKKAREIINKFKPKLIVISPGPNTPKKAGICIRLIKEFSKKIPIFGVCLGHQCIVEAFGGKVKKSTEIMHGKSSEIIHNKKGLFREVENPFIAGRYHSLAAVEIPNSLEVTAKTTNGIVMAVKHKKLPVVGVQFHPESILTAEGSKIIENILQQEGIQND